MFFRATREDVRAVLSRDPAARNAVEALLLYPSVHALFWHRRAHFLYRHKCKFLARWISQVTRFFTGIEIHPAAQIGHGTFIDHGMGVVIGETTVIGDNCTLYQGVTLGGTGKDTGKRHPTLGNCVMVGSGAKVLGPFKVGDGSKIAAGAVVLCEVPPNSTCVGVPAHVVRINGERVTSEFDLDQVTMPDPVEAEICDVCQRLAELEKKLDELQNKK